MSRVLRPIRHIIGHFGDDSFQAVTCTGTDNSKHYQKTQNKLTLGKKNTQKNPSYLNLYLTKLSTPVRNAHMCVLKTVYNCGTQYSTEQF